MECFVYGSFPLSNVLSDDIDTVGSFDSSKEICSLKLGSIREWDDLSAIKCCSENQGRSIVLATSFLQLALRIKYSYNELYKAK